MLEDPRVDSYDMKQEKLDSAAVRALVLVLVCIDFGVWVVLSKCHVEKDMGREEKPNSEPMDHSMVHKISIVIEEKHD